MRFVGIDWASEEHAVAVHDDAGKQLASFMVAHSAEGFDRLVARLRAVDDPAELPVAIERPDGRLVDRLLEAGHPVVAVSPNAIKAWRDAEVVSGAKSDPGDAAVIAEYLRVRFHLLEPLRPFSDQTRALRAAVRARGDLVDQRTSANNQLEATLDAFWPGAKEVFADVTSQIALTFLVRYPTPASAAKLGEKQMAAFCKKHGYTGRRSPAELMLAATLFEHQSAGLSEDGSAAYGDDVDWPSVVGSRGSVTRPHRARARTSTGIRRSK
jgi:transposase